MVGRLVEDEEIRRIVEHLREHEPRLLAAGEHAARLFDVVAREAEAPASVRSEPIDARGNASTSVSSTRLVRVEQVHRVLREVAELHAGARRAPCRRRAPTSPAIELEERATCPRRSRPSRTSARGGGSSKSKPS